MSDRDVPSLSDIQAFFEREFPHNGTVIEQLSHHASVVRHPVGTQHLRPGQTVMGPVMMALADTAAYCCLLSRGIEQVQAVTSSLHISFLGRPVAHRDLLAEARPLKVGRRLAVVDVKIHSEGSTILVAHATVTYSMPGRSRDSAS
ncbi:PaaI family thioesterase [bacterium]|nr:PaaI family thioesterase [bacterium]